jgi:epoxide hydrolase-like predicted phosphatase
MSTGIFASFDRFSATEGRQNGTVATAFRSDPAALDALIRFEEGRISEADFEQIVARRLGIAPDRATGLALRLVDGLLVEESMVDAVRTLRTAGVRTILVSNSWGVDRYPHALLSELFDEIVLSGNVGVRKPDRGIYDLAVLRSGQPAASCVFVDDLGGNLKPARAMGMATIKHSNPAVTIAALAELFGVDLG